VSIPVQNYRQNYSFVHFICIVVFHNKTYDKGNDLKLREEDSVVCILILDIQHFNVKEWKGKTSKYFLYDASECKMMEI
jgi:hypothetical protein